MCEKKSCASRIREALSMRNMTQAELCAQSGIKKSAMSQYVNGNLIPRQDKIYLMAKSLNVSEAWLMGFPVQMERRKVAATQEELPQAEKDLLTLFRLVPEDKQAMVLEMIRAALKSQG